MKRFLALLFLAFCVARPVFADPEDFRTQIVLTGADLTINVPNHRLIRIVNFVQDQTSDPRARVEVMKDNKTAIVMRASFVDDRDSAEDKGIRIAGEAMIVVHNTSPGNAFVTYRVTRE